MSLWTQTSKTLLHQTFLFRHFRVGYRSNASGKEGVFDVLETRDWINVIPITESGEALMVRQFRYGVGKETLEFPAGMVEPGQSPLETAKRELLEETGAEAAEVREVGRCLPNPAIMNNTCYQFVATGVSVTKAQSLDEHEEIEIVRVPLEKIPAMIASGEISHALSITTWYFYQASKGAPPR